MRGIFKCFYIINITSNDEGTPEDLMLDPEYKGRVQHLYNRNSCKLRITDLRERDSAQYQFRFTTTDKRSYTGSPGVSLSVTEKLDYIWAELKCQSSCQSNNQSFIWMKNGSKILRETSSSFSVSVYSADIYSCALKGYKEFPSPSVCKFSKLSFKIRKLSGWEVTHNMPHKNIGCAWNISDLTNVYFSYSVFFFFFKSHSSIVSLFGIFHNKSQLIFSSIQSSDSGQYDCVAANQLGRKRSQSRFSFIDSQNVISGLVHINTAILDHLKSCRVLGRRNVNKAASKRARPRQEENRLMAKLRRNPHRPLSPSILLSTVHSLDNLRLKLSLEKEFSFIVISLLSTLSSFSFFLFLISFSTYFAVSIKSVTLPA
uniref:Ig-like domain-containing protein n=1 Tax=Cyprinodon variegatus TaxID=28743 RepID=A0A3Q2FSU7_CYPVA